MPFLRYSHHISPAFVNMALPTLHPSLPAQAGSLVLELSPRLRAGGKILVSQRFSFTFCQDQPGCYGTTRVGVGSCPLEDVSRPVSEALSKLLLSARMFSELGQKGKAERARRAGRSRSSPGLAGRPSPRTQRGAGRGARVGDLRSRSSPRRKDMALFMRIATRGRDSLAGGAPRWSRVGLGAGEVCRRNHSARVPAPPTDYFLECGLFPKSASISITVCGVS